MRFSQNDEDLHILRYFGNEVGTFLDAGANDARTRWPCADGPGYVWSLRPWPSPAFVNCMPTTRV